MRLVLLEIVLVGILAQSTAAGEKALARHRADLSGAVDDYARSSLRELVAFYKDLHAHPELSMEEKESSKKIAARLEAAGYKVTTGVGQTGVVAILSSGDGPTVLVRGDMDALPIVEETGLPYASTVQVKREDGHTVGVMHACGHDIHQTCLVGTAEALAKLKTQWRGKLMIVAQPGEEIGKGARLMLEDGLFERFGKPDYCIALHVSSEHPAGTISYTSGWALANVDSVDITIHGRGGHGSRPHETIDPIVMAAHVVTALQTIVSRRVDPNDEAVVTVGSIHGGSKHNIIPNEAKLQITVRSYKEETRQLLLEGIRRITVNTCRALGAERDPDISIHDDEFTPSTYNDPQLTEAGAEVFRQLLGPERVVPRDPVMGGEDFSRYLREAKTPGFMFWLGSVPQGAYDASRKPDGPPLPSVHSSKYYPDPEPTIETGVRGMTSLALSLLATP
ncbi:MAG: amidohydrolase [Planctomycetota bacterium]